jgi:hypothetical protein
MAGNLQPIFIKAANVAECTYLPADTTTPKVVFTPDATNGSKLFAINTTSDDTANHSVQVWIYDGSTNYLLGTVPVPAYSGTDGVNKSVNLLDPVYLPCLDADGELFLPSGSYTVKCSTKVTVTAAKTLTFIAMGANY